MSHVLRPVKRDRVIYKLKVVDSTLIAWKVSIYGVFLVRIFPNTDLIRTREIPNTDTFHTVSNFKIVVYYDEKEY